MHRAFIAGWKKAWIYDKYAIWLLVMTATFPLGVCNWLGSVIIEVAIDYQSFVAVFFVWGLAVMGVILLDYHSLLSVFSVLIGFNNHKGLLFRWSMRPKLIFMNLGLLEILANWDQIHYYILVTRFFCCVNNVIILASFIK